MATYCFSDVLAHRWLGWSLSQAPDKRLKPDR